MYLREDQNIVNIDSEVDYHRRKTKSNGYPKRDGRHITFCSELLVLRERERERERFGKFPGII